MATGKGVGGNKGKGGMDWGAGVRSDVVQRPASSNSSESHVQKYVSAALVVVFAVLVMLIPALALMWGDLNAALVRAEAVISRVQVLQTQLNKERREFLEEKANERTTQQTGLDDH